MRAHTLGTEPNAIGKSKPTIQRAVKTGNVLGRSQ